MSCLTACAQDVPQQPGAGCDIVTRSSGIKRAIFMRCDIVWADITDISEWQTKLTANEVHATGDILGSKPKGSVTKKRLSSCGTERVVSGEKSVQWTDANADNNNFADYDFYNTIADNQGKYLFAYLTCDGLLYNCGEFAIEVDDVRTDNSDDEMVFDASVTYKKKNMIKPVLISGLDAILN